jgi:hypothetical protein
MLSDKRQEELTKLANEISKLLEMKEVNLIEALTLIDRLRCEIYKEIFGREINWEIVDEKIDRLNLKFKECLKKEYLKNELKETQ